MRACWMFMMLLSCKLPHAAKSLDVCPCKDKLKTVCVPAGGHVFVPCPKLIGQEVRMNFFKDHEVIYNYTCKQAPNCKPQNTRVGVELHGNKHNKSFSFLLNDVNSSSFGFYGCEGIKVFPPPFIKSTLWILVLVEGHQCNFPEVERTPEMRGDREDGFLWIWILGLALLCTYSFIITIIAYIFWVKWRNSDSQSDYMNTKPKSHKDRKKKRGVQIPIPRHF